VPSVFVLLWLSILYTKSSSAKVASIVVLLVLLFALFARFFMWIFDPPKYLEAFYKKKLKSQTVLIKMHVESGRSISPEERESMVSAILDVCDPLEHMIALEPNRTQLSLSVAMLMSVMLFIVLHLISYATIFWGIRSMNPASFSGMTCWFDALYFSIISFAAVGYGDILPLTVPARVMTLLEILSAMFILVIFLFSLTSISSRVMDEKIAFYKKESRKNIISLRELVMANELCEVLERIEAIISRHGIAGGESSGHAEKDASQT
jgi:hypothetical protein